MNVPPILWGGAGGDRGTCSQSYKEQKWQLALIRGTRGSWSQAARPWESLCPLYPPPPALNQASTDPSITGSWEGHEETSRSEGAEPRPGKPSVLRRSLSSLLRLLLLLLSLPQVGKLRLRASGSPSRAWACPQPVPPQSTAGLKPQPA